MEQSNLNLGEMKRRDTLNFNKNKDVKKALKKDEKQVWSGELTKINRAKRRQVRRFFLTNERFFNFGDNKFADNFLAFFRGTKVKRSIYLAHVIFVTYSTTSNEFVMHVPKEYDYRLSSNGSRDDFIWYCLKLRERLNVENLEPIKFYFRENIELGIYTKNENEKKEKLPPGKPIEMTADTFIQWKKQKDQAQKMSIEQTETIFNKLSADIDSKLTEDNFEIIRVLGRGAFGKVNLCVKKDTRELYAIKIISKAEIIERGHIDQIKSEKDILVEMNHPFQVSLEFCFHNPTRIFFGMKFQQGGELFQQLKSRGRFPEYTCKFYAAQILLAFEFLHQKNIIYRDLKPENVMLESNGYLKIVDFGVCKRLSTSDARAQTIVGTAEYLPPEIIIQKGHNKSADWWSFGIFLYEMQIGVPPFYSKNQHEMFVKIIKEDFKFPPEVPVSDDCKDLIRKLLTKNPDHRLGTQKDAEMIKDHPWFSDMDFDMLCKYELIAPYIPTIDSKYDTHHFDKAFTTEDPRNTKRDDNENLIIENFDHEFANFEYQKQE